MEEKDVYELAKQEAEASGHELEQVTITQGDSHMFGGDEKTIYANDALNQGIYGDGQTNANLYGVGNTDLYGGALHNTTIYNIGQGQEQAAPQVEPEHVSREPEQAAQGNAGQESIEAQKAAMVEEMRARREQERSSENERGR